MAAQPKNQMTELLAFHIGRQDRVTKWVAALQHHVDIPTPQELIAIQAGMEQAPADGVQPQQQNADRLTILIDGDSQKMVTDLYQQYVSETNFVLFIEFVKGMDRYIQQFRKLAQTREIAQQVPQEEDEEGAEVGRGPRRGRRGRRGPGKPAPVLDAAPPANPDELNTPDAPAATVASGPATKALAQFFGSHISGR